MQGNLDIYDTSELRPSDTITGRATMYDLKLHNLIQVIYGRLSEKDHYKLTLVMDIFTLGFKERDDISEEFYFQKQSHCRDLVELIRFVNNHMENEAASPEETIAYQLAQYNRKTHLFIID